MSANAKTQRGESIDLIQARLNEAQRMAGIGNWDWNIETNELWWSDEIYRMFQIDPEIFAATYEAFLERVHPDDRETVNDAVNRALKDEIPYSIDHRISLPDGTEKVVHEHAEVTFDGQRRPVRMAGTVQDITQRVNAEYELRRRAASQSMLAELSTELIRARPDNIDALLTKWFEKVGKSYGVDVVSMWWFTEDRDRMRPSHRWAEIIPRGRLQQLSRADIPWIAERLIASEIVIIDDIENMPPVAVTDQAFLRQLGSKSVLVVPLLADEDLQGNIVFTVVRQKYTWSPETVTELRLIGENIATAFARTRATAEIERLKEQLEAENVYLREEIRLAHGFDEIIGEDPGLQQCLLAVEKVATTDIPVLIQGETGTGKELIARSVHRLSARQDEPMVCVNCPALQADLIESELFGHEKGAFSGAHAQRKGRFELAGNGTLFLDEIGDLSLDLQSKLLRVLQTGDFQRIGGNETLHSNVRLVAATNRDLSREADRGEFRADLYYRINTFPIRLPALRERDKDIPLLAEHFVHKHAGRLGKTVNAISAKMMKELVEHTWPGNVRELESTIVRALISSTGSSVLKLPISLRPADEVAKAKPSLPLKQDAGLSTFERSHIVNALDQAGGKIGGDHGAAAMLGMPASTLRSKMSRLGIRRQTT